MKLEQQGSVVMVTLSRRNLQTLLNKLDDSESERTLMKRDGGRLLVVTAEEDEPHYRNRPEGGPGEVHPKHDPDRMKEAA